MAHAIDQTTGKPAVFVTGKPAWHGLGKVIDKAVVEVRYLYAFPEGRLYQPVYLGRRDDVGAEACGREQLKFKAEGEQG